MSKSLILLNSGAVAQGVAVLNNDGNNAFALGSSNASKTIRDACEVYPNTAIWEPAEVGGGDFIVQRGNTAGACWIEISKSPFDRDTETVLTVSESFKMPFKLSSMTSMTHRNAGGQVASLEIVSDDTGLDPMPPIEPVALLNASQSTTTITLNFVSAPAVPFRVGQVVSTYGFTDTRLNVNGATVASVVSPTQITIVGNDYTFTSTTIASTGVGAPFIERVDQIGLARNGLSVVSGSGTVTQKRFYVRAQGGLASPSGTLAGSHQVTTGSDTAAVLTSAPYAEAFAPATETFVLAQQDVIVVGDRIPDGNSNISARFTKSQIVPNPARDYKVKFRVRNAKSLTRPVGKILSISKAGSTTATIVFVEPHDLTTGEYVGFYGVNDQTNFANQETGLACTVVDANTITVVHGSSATATSYGGFVMRVQGQQPLGGVVAQVGQSVSRTENVVTLIGNATWASPATIGNIIELIGCRDLSGADIGIDGSYVVRNIATTALTLAPVDGKAPVGSDIVSTNCGAGVVQRLGLRIHGCAAIDFNPMMIEPAYKGLAAVGEAIQATVISMPSSSGVAGSTAQDSVVPNPVAIGGRASNTNQTAMSANGDLVHTMHTMIGAMVDKPYCIPEAEWNYTGALTTTSDVAAKAAAGAGLKNHVTLMQATNTGGSANGVLLRDGTTTRLQITVPAGQSVVMPLPTGLRLTANTALNVALSAAGTVRVNLLGYTAP